MSKKKYPIVSIFVAVVWAVFFYPADPAPATPKVSKALAGVPAVVDAARPDTVPRKGAGQRTASLSAK